MSRPLTVHKIIKDAQGNTIGYDPPFETLTIREAWAGLYLKQLMKEFEVDE
jgi:hypothetical protein